MLYTKEPFSLDKTHKYNAGIYKNRLIDKYGKYSQVMIVFKYGIYCKVKR